MLKPVKLPGMRAMVLLMTSMAKGKWKQSMLTTWSRSRQERASGSHPVGAEVTRNEEGGRSGERDNEPKPRLSMNAMPTMSADRGHGWVTRPGTQLWPLRRGHASGLESGKGQQGCPPPAWGRYEERGKTTCV